MSDRFARKLTDASVRNARPKVKPYKMADGGDLCLLVQPNGARLWQYKFRTNGREGVQALGVYPDVSLASAHVANQAAVADGVNPVRKRRVDRQEADALRLDASRIAVAGDCSGGNMAAAVAMLAKQRRGPEITFQLLLYPTVAGPTPFESAPGDQRATDWLTREELQRRIDVEFPLVGSRKEATAFPLNASTLDLNDLPEALVMVAECDVTRATMQRNYARRLTQAGVIVTCIRYNGVIHDFLSLNVLCEASVVRSATAQAIEALHDALYGS